MSKVNGEILGILIKKQIKQEKIKKARTDIIHIHNMRLNRVISLENKLKMKSDIAFRELAYEIRQDFDKIERKKDIITKNNFID